MSPSLGVALITTPVCRAHQSLIPGIFLIGSALARYGIVARIEDSIRVPLLLLGISAAASVPAVVWQLDDLASSNFNTSSAVAGVMMAGVYVTGLLVALHTPARRVLVPVFAPLGQMALTNYLSATPAVIAGGTVLDLAASNSWSLVLGVATAIITVQWGFSTWWLARYQFGPLEWLWRWATWGARPAMTS